MDNPFYPVTHEVLNQPTPLADFNMFTADTALMQALRRENAGWAEADITLFGEDCGSAERLELGYNANNHPPEFDSHDRFGHRVDLVSYHPAYHRLMKCAIERGLHASPWTAPRPGAHAARAAEFYMQSQVEAGHGCPITMTFACPPALRKQKNLADFWLPKIQTCLYDPRNVPAEQKQGLTVGMAKIGRAHV